MKEIEMALPSLIFSRREKREISIEKTDVEIKETFNELFIPLSRNLYNFIFKSTNFSEDANDVFQETVMRALKYFKKFDRTKSFKPWIFTIANNEIKRHFKNKSFLYSDKNVDALCEKFHDEAERKLVKAIYIVAENLKPRDRQVFFLFYDNGFSITEISVMTGIKTGYIKVILSNARKAVRKLLEVRNEK
ncbi:MAG: RNA polymerase sigma factor [Acidobacteriota bacterium]